MHAMLTTMFITWLGRGGRMEGSYTQMRAVNYSWKIMYDFLTTLTVFKWLQMPYPI